MSGSESIFLQDIETMWSTSAEESKKMGDSARGEGEEPQDGKCKTGKTESASED